MSRDRVEIRIEDAQVQALLGRLQAFPAESRRVLGDIGEHLVETTKRRFETASSPDGTPWAPNSQTTLERFLEKYRGSFDKKGRATKKAFDRITGKKPLTGETGYLKNMISYRVDSEGLTISPAAEYARIQQFGAKQGQFGRSMRGAPLPWGDIPARPFLGASTQDVEFMKDALSRALMEAALGRG